MKTVRNFLLAMSAMLVLWSPQGHADDIDIYSGNPVSGVPNILFVMDTGANFSNSAAVPCTAYSVAAGGGAPSLGDTAGGIEQCALVEALTALADGAVNIGILVNNDNNFGTDTRLPTDVAYHETCQGTYGGCVIRKLAFMDAAGKANLIAFIKSWNTTNAYSATTFNVKSGGDRTANTMQEAWAYYNGKSGMSGKNYSPSILASGCQKNFIIFIGNAFNNAGGPADGGSESPDNVTNGLRSTQVGATAAQLVKITGANPGDTSVTFSPSTCGVTSIAASNAGSNWSVNWADEWARLMNQQDGAGDLQNAQNITTYTIGVVNDSGCKADYPALLTTMAKYGGGKYFKTSNVDEIKNALETILNEIQAVNSVFASASLPVSVNAEGTFLNQIFLGMFRPDASANPRWLGNLKQYQLVFSSGNLILGDATGAPALSAAGTGFISAGATSFWTSKTVATVPDSTGGFYQNDPRGDPPSGYDLPDGQLVEKGGAAQQLRIESMTANFAASAATSSNPRRLYTYCPSGASCNATLSDSSNAFAAENIGVAGISATAFGDSTTVAISSITRSGSTAEVVTSGNHGFTSGVTSVTISNVTNPTSYNGTYVVQDCAVLPSPACFKITGLGNYPNTPSVNAYTFATLGAGSVNVSSMTRTTNGTNSSGSGLNKETVTVTTAGHAFLAGSSVTISGASPSAYNGNHVIAVPGTGACPTLTCFTFEITITPTSPAVNTYTAVVSPTGASRNISSITDSGSTATVTTTSAHGFHVGQIVRIDGTGNGRYDFNAAPSGSNTGTDFTVASISGAAATSTVFTFTGFAGNPANVATVGTVKPSTTGIAIVPSRAAGTDTVTITATGATAGAFGNAINGTKVLDISKATGTSTNEAAYVASGVTITCTAANCSSFTYGPVATSPSTTITTATTITATPVSGGSVTIAAGNISRSGNGSTATVTGATANLFGSGIDRTGSTSTVTVAQSSGSASNASAYLGSGTWTITCTNATCTSFTFGDVTLTPTTPAVGTNMQAYAAGSAPDGATLIKWVRGEDNFKDELGPGSPVTVRPSTHGDVLHSRPLVVNYGDSRGLVAFYGSNEGIFHAVNGSQTAAIGSVPAGGELWGLVLQEHYGQLNRQRVNTPELRLPTTTLDSAQLKDYFVDGATGAFQQIKADGTIDKAYLYLTMRRGGRFIYALDVSTPTDPKFLWKMDYNGTTTASGTTLDAKFASLGQTWSRPRVTIVNGYANPVLIFAGGYDGAEDSEPPTANTMGNSIFVVDAVTGVRVWSATYGASANCTGTATQADCTVPGMLFSMPSEVAFRDRDSDGKTDRMYVGDMGGNVWRVDFKTSDGTTTATTPDKWRVTKLASLGCATGTCTVGVTTPRKFFFPPTVISVGATGASGSYEAVLIGSGDREHPLTSTVAESSHLVKNRFYMIKDTLTATNPTRSGTDLAGITGITLRTEATLFQAFKTSTISQFVRTANVMTVTTTAAHGFTAGQTVVIDGASPATLDGQFTIIDAGTAGSTTFTYASTGANSTTASAGSATVVVPFTASNTEPGFFSYLAKGEKVVNAPITVSGTAFFGTNRPFTPGVNTCASNLGEARGYAFDPFSGSSTSVVYDGGGLPPSPVAGVVTVNKDGVDTLVRFCIGCGGSDGSGGSGGVDSPLENTDPFKAVPKKPTRTYWYRR
jgi:type IV pilus assembly protein PilY1